MFVLFVIFIFCFLFVNYFFRNKSPISHLEKWGLSVALQKSDTLFTIKYFALPLAHPGLDLSAHRAELSVINTLYLFSGRDIVAYGTVAVDVIDIALRRMIGATFLGHDTSSLITISFAFGG